MTEGKSVPMWHVYVRAGKAYIPTVSKTDAGYFLDIDPVSVVSMDDRAALAEAIGRTMSNGNPSMAAPTRAAFPKPVVLKYAGTPTWSQFVKKAACFTIYLRTDRIEIHELSRGPKGEWTEDPSRLQVISAEASSDLIAAKILAHAEKRTDLG